LKDIVKPAVVLFIICFAVSAALALTYSATREKIAERASIDAENAKREVLQKARSFKAVDINELVKGNSQSDIVREAYVGLNGSKVEGYVFSTVTKGYGGDINIIVGVDMDGRVTGVKVGDNKETPGLGTKASEKPFLSQLVDIIPTGEFVIVKTKKTKPEEVEAISGATITSRAVVKAVQAAVSTAAELKKNEIEYMNTDSQLKGEGK